MCYTVYKNSYTQAKNRKMGASTGICRKGALLLGRTVDRYAEEEKEPPVTGKQEAADSRKVAISVKNLAKILLRGGDAEGPAPGRRDLRHIRGKFVAPSEPPSGNNPLNMLAGLGEV